MLCFYRLYLKYKLNIMSLNIKLLLLVSIISTAVFAQEPTRWRGPNANGIYPDKGLLKEWPSSGPEIIWSYNELGEGHSSPAISNGKIYLTGMEGETGFIYIFNLQGKFLEKFEYGKEFTESYPGSRSTPTIVGDLLYIMNGFGEVFCYDLSTKKMNWEKKLHEELDGENIRWGVTETLVVDGDKIYCTPGGKKNNVVALNRLNGNLVWSCPGLGELSAYCTPLMVDHGSNKLLVTHTANHVLGINRETGKLLWSHSQPNRWSVHANTPIYAEGEIYYLSGYGQGGGKLKLNAEGTSVTSEWFEQKADNRIGGAVVIDGCLYASGDNFRELFCIDGKSGEMKWSSKEVGKGVTIAAGNMLILYTERGELALVEATPDAFSLKGKTRVTMGSAQHWAHPVVHDGILYVRHGSALIAYKIS